MMGIAKSRGGMGFQDLHSFNKALLAKQGWRLMQEPDSLVGTVLKAKYFKNVSFLEAKKGSQASYAWQSILAARDILNEGMHWRIGNGKSVKIWGDRWVPRPTSYKIQSPVSMLAMDAKVEQIIDIELGEWNVSLIRAIFNEEEANLICQLPLSKYIPPDRLIWRGTSTGIFTVRSAYHLEMEIKARKKGEGSSQNGNQLIWKTIWELGVPNAAKVFLWRACTDILPTRVNL
jgi:hypothetical protein